MAEQALQNVGERAGIPIYSWAPRWWDLLTEFAEVAAAASSRSAFQAFPDTAVGRPPQLLYPVETLPEDVRGDMAQLAAALFDQDIPAGGIGLLSGMTALLGSRTGAFFAALPPFIRQIAGDDAAAVHIPIGPAGEADGRFPLHADLFPSRVLLNVFQRPDPGEGEALLMAASTFLQLLKPLVAEQELLWLTDTLAGVNCTEDGYDTFQRIVWHRNFSDELRRVTAEQSLRFSFGPGEGYWVHDGSWLHGRGYLSAAKATYARLHRLTYSTRNFRSRPVQRLLPAAEAGLAGDVAGPQRSTVSV